MATTRPCEQFRREMLAPYDVMRPPWVTYAGVPVWKWPTDLWVYQEIIAECRPDLIIETGTAFGGSALYFSQLLDTFSPGGQVITIDVADYVGGARSPKVHYVTASSLHPSAVAVATSAARDHKRVMVTLDGDHSAKTVRTELDLYGPLVTPGQYLVVEDTYIDRYLDVPDGPWTALSGWLPEHPEFVNDVLRDGHPTSTNPGGWLRRQP